MLCLVGAGALLAGAVVAGGGSQGLADMKPAAAHPSEPVQLAAIPPEGAEAEITLQSKTRGLSEQSATQKLQAALETTPPLPAFDAAPAISTTAKAPVSHQLTVRSGDTLMKMLTGEGVTRGEAHAAIQALSEVFSPRKLRPGHDITLELTPADAETDAPALTSLRLTESPVRSVEVAALNAGGFEARIIDTPTEKTAMRADGTISSSLYEAAVEAGVPLPVLADMIQVFSFDVDFQREVRRGDTFALLYDIEQVSGETVGTGAVHMAEMTVAGEPKRYYRFKGSDGFWDYFDEQGRSAKKALLRTPIDGARLSSKFGMRRHPILGYNKMHKGADFAAPTGTPIYAAGNGVVEAAGWNGGYGKYIRVRHNDTYKTAYGHMSRIAVSRGKRVRQGQVIGYVGSTGRSTGPHLHYEVHKNGRQVNPLGVRLPTGRTLSGSELAAFKDHVARLESQFAALPARRKLASAD
ncbi:MAG: M23 family metallopeptidase [Alphaproteobacteria bacterium]|nr:M23 family metallopeptidase [Alphaproteobacteria bacterium]